MGLENRAAAPRTTSEAKRTVYFMIRDELSPKAVPKDAPATSFERLVRRPYGMTVKEDTYAFLELYREDPRGGAPIALFNENYVTGALADGATYEGTKGAFAPYTNNFIIRTFSERREEKYQLLETFGDNFVFFFGERPRLITVSGLLMDTLSHEWVKEWLLNYDRYLRGTKAVENRAIAILHINDVSISGYILSTSLEKTSDLPYTMNFSFQMVVVDYHFDPAFGGEENLTEPTDSLVYFGERLSGYADYRADKFGRQQDFFGELVQTLKAGDAYVNKQLNNLYISEANRLAYAAATGSLTNVISSAASSTYTIYNYLNNTGTNLASLKQFQDGFVDIVEYRGRPIEFYPVNDTGLTLRQAGMNILLSTIDNSLYILLNLRESPVIRMQALVYRVIDSALSLLGIESSLYANMLNLGTNLDKLVKSSVSQTIDAVGLDVVFPMIEVTSTTVGPEENYKVIVNTTEEEKVAAGVYGTSNLYEFSILNLPSGFSERDIREHPSYLELPRAWRLKLETSKESALEKLRFLSKDGEDGIILIIRRAKNLEGLPSSLSKELQA